MAGEPRLEDELKAILVERLFLDLDPGAIEEDAELMEAYGVDSVGLLEMVVGLEENYGITFEDDEEFDVSQFRTIRSIADYVRKKRGDAGGS